MKSSAAALLAIAPSVYALGSANIVNNCGNTVYLWNVPSAGGGGVEVDKQLAPGESYSQTYQTLSNNNGWSFKLSPTDSQDPIMQFEYTYQGNNMLWFDISYVNGDPFNGNWFLSSDSGSCVPKQTYYRYSTDDVNGMQPACSPETSITVTMCPGGNSGSAASVAAPISSVVSQIAAQAEPPATSAPAPPPSSVAPTSAPPAPPAPQVTTKVHKDKGVAPAFNPADEGAAVAQIFTTMVTQVITVDYTATVNKPRATHLARDVHRHQHHHLRHQHAHI